MTASSAESSKAPYWLIVPSVVLYCGLCIRIFGFVVDDAYISFLYAKTFVEHYQLCPGPGRYIQGYTNFLYVVLCAVLYALVSPDSLEAAAKILMLIAGGGTIILVGVILRNMGVSWWASAPTLAWLSTNTPFIVWTMGGLETPLVCLEYAAGCLAMLRQPRNVLLFFVVFLAGALTRLDATIFLSFLLCGILLHERNTQPRNLLCFLAIVIGVLAAYFAWAHSYYGSFLPQSFHAKATKTITEIISRTSYEGVSYFADFLAVNQHWAGFVAIVIVSVASLRSRRGTESRVDERGLLWGAAGTFAYSAYVISQGTVHMAFTFRLYVPLIPIMAIYLGLALDMLSDRTKYSAIRWFLGLGLTFLALISNLVTYQHAYYENMLLSDSSLIDFAHRKRMSIRSFIEGAETWKLAARQIAEVVPGSARVYSDTAGMVPYFVKAQVYDEGLIGEPSNKEYDYAVWECRCSQQFAAEVNLYPIRVKPETSREAGGTCLCLAPYRVFAPQRALYSLKDYDVEYLFNIIWSGDTHRLRKALMTVNGINSAAQKGITPLMLAAKLGNERMVRILLEHGADVNAVDIRGFSALHFAVWNGHAGTVQLLLDHGAILRPNQCITTPLLLSALKGHESISELLISNGIDKYLNFAGVH
jgi:hypothetical protein